MQGLGDPASKSCLYTEVAGGFRLIDVAILVLFAVHAFALGCSRHRARQLPHRVILPLAGFGIAIAISVIYGLQHGGRNVFFDWRAIALGVALYTVYRFWIQTAVDAQWALLVFIVVTLIRIAHLLISYVAGHGDVLLGVRIPLFDGPSLSALVFTALLTLCISAKGFGYKHRGTALVLSGAAMALVALCFRRTYWAELAIGLGIIAISRSGSRIRVLILFGAGATLAFVAMGPALLDRVTSFDFTRTDAPYSEDNIDHVGDVLDGWDQVRASPIMGVGLGRSYPTWRIRNWKDESVMVHNAPLHVWLKYGLVGLFFYLLFHFSLFRALSTQKKAAQRQSEAVLTAILAYLVAQFTVSLGFTPWAYSAVQSTNLIAFLLAIAFVRGPACHCQPFLSSHQLSTARPTSKTPYSA